MGEAVDKLTPKQRRFLDAYLTEARWNATRAAKIAGYSEHTAYSIGWELLRKPEIKAAVNERLAESAMSADEVLGLLADQARGSLEDVLDEEGRFDYAKARDAGKLHLIHQYEVSVEVTGEERPPIEKTKLKLYDAQAALALLARHHKLLTDKTEHSTPDGSPLVVVQLPDNGRNA